MTQTRRPPGGSSAKRLRIPASIARALNLDVDRVDTTEPVVETDIPTSGLGGDDDIIYPIDPRPPVVGQIPVPSFVLDSTGNVALTANFVVRNGQLLVDVQIDVNEVGDGYTYEVRFA